MAWKLNTVDGEIQVFDSANNHCVAAFPLTDCDEFNEELIVPLSRLVFWGLEMLDALETMQELFEMEANELTLATRWKSLMEPMVKDILKGGAPCN